MEERSVIGSSVVPIRFVFLMWLSFFLGIYFHWPLTDYGIVPRTFHGLIGILLGPLIHKNILHLVSNTIPLLFLGAILFFFYRRLGPLVFYRGYFWTNIMVWIFARPAVHIGASGLVYSLAFFLIFFGFFRRDFLSLFISIAILILYGGIFYGVLPSDPQISWESHLAGALVGIFTAVTRSNEKRIH